MSTLDELKDTYYHSVEVGEDKTLGIKETFTKGINDTLSMNKAKENRKKAVAERLSTLRKEAGQKQQAVAKEIGIGTVTLSGYEIGKSEPNFEILVRLADYYKISLDYLLCRTDTRIEFDKEEYAAKDAERKQAQERLQNLEQELSTIKQELK